MADAARSFSDQTRWRRFTAAFPIKNGGGDSDEFGVVLCFFLRKWRKMRRVYICGETLETRFCLERRRCEVEKGGKLEGVI
ncbi:hypothetical protein L6452_41605 [Arctium lappa]|uniref:Uncharacterized protein n=1 Tax=Arctium lappa TaxID=4217 RepID=A0ACB8XNM7_ARCLA|nr:hypothetical protein L6452_41605 [Arctium lappa]